MWAELRLRLRLLMALRLYGTEPGTAEGLRKPPHPETLHRCSDTAGLRCSKELQVSVHGRSTFGVLCVSECVEAVLTTDRR